MAFLRTNTARTCVSQAWSTCEMNSALEHLLMDKDELPDDPQKLEASVDGN